MKIYPYKDNKKKDKETLDKLKQRIKDLEEQLNSQQKGISTQDIPGPGWTKLNKICYICRNEFDKNGHKKVMLLTCGDQFGKSCLDGMLVSGNNKCPTCSHAFRAQGRSSKTKKNKRVY